MDDEIPLQGGSHASSSHEVSLESTIKRREYLGKHNVHTHFPKDRNCEICQRTKITRAPCRRRNGGAVPRAANFGDPITADHKVLNEEGESRNKTDMLSWYKSWQLNGFNLIRAKPKPSQETAKSLRNFSRAVRKAESHSHRQIFAILANLVKTYHGLIVHRRFVDLRRMVLLT